MQDGRVKTDSFRQAASYLCSFGALHTREAPVKVNTLVLWKPTR